MKYVKLLLTNLYADINPSKIDYRGINTPTVRDSQLRPVTNEVQQTLDRRFLDMYGVVPDYTSAEISVKKQPSIYGLFINKGRIVAKKIGQVFGSLNPYTNKIEIDPTVVEGKAPVSAKRVLGEELIHYAQKQFGSMANYIKIFGERARDYVEGAAATWADRWFGETIVYPGEKALYREYERCVGPERAFLGAAA